MRKTAPILFGIMILALAIPALAQAQEPGKEPPKEKPKEINISGVWDMVTQLPQGEYPSEVTFTQEKETLKVVMSGQQGTPLSGEGTVKEGVAQWTATLSTSQGDLTLFFKGKIDGEKMSGDVQMGDFGTATWTAVKRKK